MAELFGIKSKFLVYSESLFVKFCPQNILLIAIDRDETFSPQSSSRTVAFLVTLTFGAVVYPIPRQLIMVWTLD